MINFAILHPFQTTKFVVPKSSVNCDGRDLVLLAVWQLGVDNSLSVCNCPLPDKQQTSLEPFCITFRENCENVNIPNSSLLRARLAILSSWPLYWLSAEDQDLWTSSLCFLLKSWGTSLSQLEQIIRPYQFIYSMISPYDEAFQTMVQPFESQFDHHL